jgi:NADPH:quinone reductase-like Zn-dependent oxidoreductase
MHAVAITGFGTTPEIMQLPVPQPGPGEVLLRIRAAAMNPFDWKVIDGALRGATPHSFPLVLGNDAAGVIEQTGPGATRFQAGDRVFGQVMNVSTGQGSYGEFAAASEHGHLSLAPDGLPFAVAAALPTASGAAYNAVQVTGADHGKTILINGATGGVGQSAVQFATQAGATVLATASHQAAADITKLGAHHIIDYTKGNVAAQVQAVCPAGVDAVLDLVSPPGAAGIDDLATLIRPGGILVSTNHAAAVEALAARGIRAANFVNTTTEGTLASLAEMADSGALRIHIDAEITLRQAPDAIASARTGHARGKTVIIP